MATKIRQIIAAEPDWFVELKAKNQKARQVPIVAWVLAEFSGNKAERIVPAIVGEDGELVLTPDLKDTEIRILDVGSKYLEEKTEKHKKSAA